MADLTFKYGTMKSGKTLDLIRVARSYREQGKVVMILTSDKDTRSGVDRVVSRVGVTAEAISISDDLNILGLIGRKYNPDVILIDEAQFLSTEQVRMLSEYVASKTGRNIPVICYGLKNDFKNELFKGSAALLAYADSLIEIESTCQKCNSKATMTLRFNNGSPVRFGDQVQIGDSEYVPVCKEHYASII